MSTADVCVCVGLECFFCLFTSRRDTVKVWVIMQWSAYGILYILFSILTLADWQKSGAELLYICVMGSRKI